MNYGALHTMGTEALEACQLICWDEPCDIFGVLDILHALPHPERISRVTIISSASALNKQHLFFFTALAQSMQHAGMPFRFLDVVGSTEPSLQQAHLEAVCP